jgi:16S rRNA C967 or C1407 C5-methylase (RsmB/RsmF family)
VSKKDGTEPSRGEAAFRVRYVSLFGERWPALETALASPPDSLAFEAAEGLPPYYLDSASVFAASALESKPGDRILDACAAPGGKSLVLASRLGKGSRLIANELSADRRRRLRGVLDLHLDGETRSRVEVSGRDAAAMCRSFESSFDAILLDAPCSSERHVLADAKALAEWSPSRVRNLAMRQWSLLSSALIMLKDGGCIVYSTCALSPEENDGVVARAAAKLGPALVFDELDYGERGEATRFGLMILPDKALGAGPMYICRMRKNL